MLCWVAGGFRLLEINMATSHVVIANNLMHAWVTLLPGMLFVHIMLRLFVAYFFYMKCPGAGFYSSPQTPPGPPPSCRPPSHTPPYTEHPKAVDVVVTESSGFWARAHIIREDDRSLPTCVMFYQQTSHAKGPGTRGGGGRAKNTHSSHPYT